MNRSRLRGYALAAALFAMISVPSARAHGQGGASLLPNVPRAAEGVVGPTSSDARKDLEQALAEPMPPMRSDERSMYAAWVRRFARLGPSRLGPMLDRLAAGSEDSLVRAAMVEAVGRLRDPRAMPWLKALLRKEEAVDVRRSAVGALGRIGSDEAIDAALAACRADGPGQDRLIMALGSARHPRVASALAQRLAETKDPRVAYAAADALGSIASSYAWATPELQRTGLQGEVQSIAARGIVNAYLRRPDLDESVRSAMTASLGMVNAVTVKPVLEEARRAGLGVDRLRLDELSLRLVPVAR